MTQMNDDSLAARRRFLCGSVRVAALGMPLWAGVVRASTSDTRSLSMVHLHTGERVELVYAQGAQYVDPALQELNHFLRDHYSGDVGVIDPQVFDQLHAIQRALGTERSFEIISGYRCPATNANLRSTRGGGVAKTSLHMQGRAIDLRLPGVPLRELRDAALSLRAGGVGYYANDQFVHLDTGRVRNW